MPFIGRSPLRNLGYPSSNMATLTLPLLLIGDVTGSELREIAETVSSCEINISPDIDGALALIRNGYAPAVIVVEQPWPGRISASDFDELQRVAPLARIVRLLGTWMEGELRTGRPQPGTLRTYWHESATRIAQDIRNLYAGRKSNWTIPTTANDQERLLEAVGDSCAFPKPQSPAKSIAIYAQHRETAESLTEICTQCGWHDEWLREHQLAAPIAADAILVDSVRGVPAAITSIHKLRAAAGTTPILVLVGFAREDELAELRSAGAVTCVRKPFLVDDLKFQLDRFFLSQLTFGASEKIRKPGS
jgi:CheY-like chemotaxis protein